MAKGKGKRKHQSSWRYPNRNRHHIKPISRFKEEGTATDDTPSNLLLLKLKRHHAFHALFGDKTLEEAIALLLRVHRAKGRCTGLMARCLLEAQHDYLWEGSNGSASLVSESGIRMSWRDREQDARLLA